MTLPYFQKGYIRKVKMIIITNNYFYEIFNFQHKLLYLDPCLWNLILQRSHDDVKQEKEMNITTVARQDILCKIIKERQKQRLLTLNKIRKILKYLNLHIWQMQITIRSICFIFKKRLMNRWSKYCLTVAHLRTLLIKYLLRRIT